MNKNEVKKALYKQKPIAEFTCIVGTTLYYKTKVEIDDKTITVDFSIPVEEIGDAVFYKEMYGQFLNRYIVEEQTETPT